MKLNRIKEVLEENGIKQVWLAEKLEKSPVQINLYVNNKRQPTLLILFQISEILKIDIRELLVITKKADQALAHRKEADPQESEKECELSKHRYCDCDAPIIVWSEDVGVNYCERCGRKEKIN